MVSEICRHLNGSFRMTGIPLRFVRYADDCIIAVGSSASANRVMHTVTSWIERKLGLKVNMSKTKVTNHEDRPAPKSKDANCDLEAMEDESETILGGLRKLGAPEWMAKKSVAFADHYQAVAKTTGLHLISKEILARIGLQSCLDYYLN